MGAAEAIQSMVSSGFTMEQAVKAVDICQATGAWIKDAAAEKRRAWDRERKRLAKPNSTGMPKLSTGKTGLIPPELPRHKKIVASKGVNEWPIFWEAWPHKVGRKDAERAFFKIAAQSNGSWSATLEAIMSGIERYVRDKPADRNWMHPATFLNGARWNDDPSPLPQKSRGWSLEDMKAEINGEPYVEQPVHRHANRADHSKPSAAGFAGPLLERDDQGTARTLFDI